MPGRAHSAELKLTVVREVESGEKRMAQVCREHGLSESLVHRWRRQYIERGEAAFRPLPVEGPGALARRVAELERFCGQLALENALLKKGLASVPSRSVTR
jgi:transposase-like protein